jgi:hypothetical protein
LIVVFCFFTSKLKLSSCDVLFILAGPRSEQILRTEMSF